VAKTRGKTGRDTLASPEHVGWTRAQSMRGGGHMTKPSGYPVRAALRGRHANNEILLTDQWPIDHPKLQNREWTIGAVQMFDMGIRLPFMVVVFTKVEGS
jgi:hypothetical protein